MQNEQRGENTSLKMYGKWVSITGKSRCKKEKRCCKCAISDDVHRLLNGPHTCLSNGEHKSNGENLIPYKKYPKDNQISLNIF